MFFLLLFFYFKRNGAITIIQATISRLLLFHERCRSDSINIYQVCELCSLTNPFCSSRPDILKSEVIIPKMDSSVMQITIPACPNRSSTSPSRSRRVKTRHRKPGKGSSGDLAGLKANQSSPNRDSTTQTNGSTTNTSKQLLEPSAALRGLGHEQQQRQLSSSSPDLICTTLKAEAQEKGPPSAGGFERGGSLSASAGLGGSEAGAAGLDDLTETPPRSDTPSEDAASFPFSSSPDSPCGRGAAARRASLGSPRLLLDAEDKEEGAGAVRLPRGASGGIGSQHLTPSAILYRAAITRKQVGRPPAALVLWERLHRPHARLFHFLTPETRGVLRRGGGRS